MSEVKTLCKTAIEINESGGLTVIVFALHQVTMVHLDNWQEVEERLAGIVIKCVRESTQSVLKALGE